MVLITFKTITQLSFTLELEPTLTIAEVKKEIATSKGEDYAVELQKLIYNGKILADESSIQDVGIESSKFVVVMLQRKKAPKVDPAPATNSATTATTTTTSTASSGKLETTPAPEQLSNNSTPAPASTTSNSTPAPAADEEVITAEQEEMIKNIVSMGYPRDQTIAMLRASLWNPDRAVDLLLTGDPEGEAMGFVEEDNRDNVPNNLDILGQLPQIEELRNAVRENPSILPSLMRQIAQINPDLMNAISQDQEGFLRLIGGPSAQAAERPAQQNTIRLTEEEHAAVMRIKDMGFNVPEHWILEAYLACDKNEEMAVEYLLQRMDEGDI